MPAEVPTCKNETCGKKLPDTGKKLIMCSSCFTVTCRDCEAAHENLTCKAYHEGRNEKPSTASSGPNNQPGLHCADSKAESESQPEGDDDSQPLEASKPVDASSPDLEDETNSQATSEATNQGSSQESPDWSHDKRFSNSSTIRNSKQTLGWSHGHETCPWTSQGIGRKASQGGTTGSPHGFCNEGASTRGGGHQSWTQKRKQSKYNILAEKIRKLETTAQTLIKSVKAVAERDETDDFGVTIAHALRHVPQGAHRQRASLLAHKAVVEYNPNLNTDLELVQVAPE